MFCKYCRVGDFSAICTCEKDGQICPFVRRCTNEHRWKPLPSMEKCKARKDEVIVPKGLNKVRFELHGELYVEIGDFVYAIKNPYDHKPEFVKVIQVDGVWYIDGFEPKQDKEELVQDDKPTTEQATSSKKKSLRKGE